jgi:hypothetical protein
MTIQSNAILDASAGIIFTASADLQSIATFRITTRHFANSLLSATSLLSALATSVHTGCGDHEVKCHIPGVTNCVSTRYSTGFGWEHIEALIPALAECFTKYGEYLKTIPQIPQPEITLEDQQIVQLPIEFAPPALVTTMDLTAKIAAVKERLLTAEHIQPSDIPVFGFIPTQDRKILVETEQQAKTKEAKNLNGLLKTVKDKKANILAKRKEKVKI